MLLMFFTPAATLRLFRGAMSYASQAREGRIAADTD